MQMTVDTVRQIVKEEITRREKELRPKRSDRIELKAGQVWADSSNDLRLILAVVNGRVFFINQHDLTEIFNLDYNTVLSPDYDFTYRYVKSISLWDKESEVKNG